MTFAPTLDANRTWMPDLHMHTSASDGLLSPSDLVMRAKAQGVNLMAVTDHDTLNGLEDASIAAREAGIQLIPGIEITTQGEEEIHLLGYFVQKGNAGLDDLLAAIRHDRAEREPRFLRRLGEMGMPVTHEDLRIPDGTMFSRPLLAHAMTRLGYVQSVQDAFDRYLGVGKPAYIPRLHVPIEQAISILRGMRAVPVLAHPGLIRKPLDECISLLDEWVSAGLMGIEAFHPTHSQEECRYWEQVARSRGLLVTGGSDFHDLPDALHGEVGHMLSQWHNATQDAQALLDCATQTTG